MDLDFSLKNYVNVILKVTREGEVIPLAVSQWNDRDRCKIDRIVAVHKAGYAGMGSFGNRYTVEIAHRIYELHDDDGRWELVQQ